MGVKGQCICINLANSREINNHLRELGALLSRHGIAHQLFFYHSASIDLQRILAIRPMETLYIVAHAEPEKGIAFGSTFLTANHLLNQLGPSTPANVYINTCYSEELGFVEAFTALGCKLVRGNSGYINFKDACQKGILFFREVYGVG